MHNKKTGMSGRKNRLSGRKQLEQVKDEAFGAYLSHPDHDTIQAEMDDVVSDYDGRLRQAIEERNARIDAAAKRWGRGLVRAALEDVGLQDFDMSLFCPSDFMKHERGWDNPGADYEQALIKTTATMTSEPEGSLRVKFDEHGNYVGVVEADDSGAAPYRFLPPGRFLVRGTKN